jgi:hypothetical protein
MFPGVPVQIPGVPAAKKPEKAAAPTAADSQVQEAELTNLTANNSKTRIAAMQSITENLKGDLQEKDFTYRQAAIIARYLLVNILDKDELDEILPTLSPLAKSRNLLLALADNLDANDAKLEKLEPILAKLLGEVPEFGKDWRLPCRKALMVQAVELSVAAKDAVAQTAELLRDHYKVQSILVGVSPRDLEPMTRPSQVMEALIKQVAAKAAKSDAAADDKAYLEQAPRQVRAVQFVAKNDVEQTAMLQRVWLKVLCLYLVQQNPDRAAELRQAQA